MWDVGRWTCRAVLEQPGCGQRLPPRRERCRRGPLRRGRRLPDTACQDLSAIVDGEGNNISPDYNGSADGAFIGAGDFNSIDGSVSTMAPSWRAWETPTHCPSASSGQASTTGHGRRCIYRGRRLQHCLGPGRGLDGGYKRTPPARSPPSPAVTSTPPPARTALRPVRARAHRSPALRVERRLRRRRDPDRDEGLPVPRARFGRVHAVHECRSTVGAQLAAGSGRGRR